MKHYQITENGTPILVGEISMSDAQAKGLRVVETSLGRLVAVEAPDSITTIEIKKAISAVAATVAITVPLQESLEDEVKARLDKIHSRGHLEDGLRDAFRALSPEASAEAIELMVKGRKPPDEKGWFP